MTPGELGAMFEFLKTTMRERGWNIARLAEACDVDISLASKWVSENARRRVIPGPASCEKIAAALDLDPDYVLELAGHRKPRVDKSETDNRRVRAYIARRQQSQQEELDRWLKVIGPRMGRDAAEAYYWETVKRRDDAAAEQVDVILDLYARLESAVSEPATTAVSASVSGPVRRTRRRRGDSGGGLTAAWRRPERRSGRGRRASDRPAVDVRAQLPAQVSARSAVV